MKTMRIAILALMGQIVWTGAALGDGMPATTQDGSGATATMTDGSSGTATTGTSGATVTGAADSLSPGNQKIANALFENQTIGSSGQPAWSLDQIAAAKQSGEGWGEIFHQMKADDLIQAKNLGQVVSGHYQPPATGSGESTVVITNAEGQTTAVAEVGPGGRGHGTAGRSAGSQPVSGAAHGRGNGHAAFDDGAGVVTGGSESAMAGAVHGEGHGYGHVDVGGSGNGALAGAAGATTAGGSAVAAGIGHGGGYGHGHAR